MDESDAVEQTYHKQQHDAIHNKLRSEQFGAQICRQLQVFNPITLHAHQMLRTAVRVGEGLRALEKPLNQVQGPFKDQT